MELNSLSREKSGAQIHAERIRNGFCSTCDLSSSPTKCFEIKKLLGGLSRKKIPLTVAGQVWQGNCLKCHPEKDPYKGTDNEHHRARSLPQESNNLPPNFNNSAPPILGQQQEDTRHFSETNVDERPRPAVSPVRIQLEETREQEIQEQTMDSSSDIETSNNSGDNNNSSMHVQSSSPHNESDNLLQNLLSEALRNCNENPPDAMTRAILEVLRQNPAIVRFLPGENFVPNSEISIDGITVNSDITDPTYMPSSERSLLAEEGTVRITSLTTISEGREAPSTESQSSASSAQQRSIVNHQIHEPDVSESFEVSPDLSTLDLLVEEMIQYGEDVEAINTISDELIKDNALGVSVDLALYCLHKLWILAKKSDQNKQQILLEGNTFEAVIETMGIYMKKSAEIQKKACVLLWSLAMEQKDRKHVAELRGCEWVLTALKSHEENESLQEIALGALKVLSLDPKGKLKLRQEGAARIAADVMSNHMQNSKIQSEGCLIIINLATEADEYVNPVSKEQVDAVLRVILCQLDAPEVLQVACYTLAHLANSPKNLQTIREAELTNWALELAIKEHPNDVWRDVQTLQNRLRST